ncbi:5-formyltetrahydrofolate cyclo-ligase [Corynebacterium choanae]|nr:5-formyltetrahydrofolate cyclo-ligase [Corynebacterium choanae]
MITGLDDEKWRLRRRLLQQRRVNAALGAHRQEQEALWGNIQTVLAQYAPPGAAIGAYVPTREEPGADWFALLLGERPLIVPRCREDHHLDFCYVTSPDELIIGAHGLREPSPEHPAICPERLHDHSTVLLVPALAATAAGGRLGRGGGYYDRTLVALDAAVTTVAAVFSEELLPTLPQASHDATVDVVVTPQNIFTKS